MQFVDIKNDIAFRKIFGNEQKSAPLISFLNAALEQEGNEGLKTAFIEANKHNWSKEDLIAYDNASIAEQDERGKITAATNKGKKEGKKEGEESKEKELIIEMYKEGFSIAQISKITKKTAQEIEQIIENQTGK